MKVSLSKTQIQININFYQNILPIPIVHRTRDILNSFLFNSVTKLCFLSSFLVPDKIIKFI